MTRRERDAIERIQELEALLREVDLCFKNLSADDVHIVGDLPARVELAIGGDPFPMPCPRCGRLTTGPGSCSGRNACDWT
jgi:hypothetical protein